MRGASTRQALAERAVAGSSRTAHHADEPQEHVLEAELQVAERGDGFIDGGTDGRGPGIEAALPRPTPDMQRVREVVPRFPIAAGAVP